MTEKKRELGEYLTAPGHVATVVDGKTLAAAEFRTAVSTYLCQECDNAHLQIVIKNQNGRTQTVISVSLDPECAEMLSDWILHPLPLVEGEKTPMGRGPWDGD